MVRRAAGRNVDLCFLRCRDFGESSADFQPHQRRLGPVLVVTDRHLDGIGFSGVNMDLLRPDLLDGESCSLGSDRELVRQHCRIGDAPQ